MDHPQPQQQQSPIPAPPTTTTTTAEAAPVTTTTAAASAAVVSATPFPSQFEPQPSPPQPQSPLPQLSSTSSLNPNPNPRPAILPPGRPPIALPRPASSAASTTPRGVGGVALGVPAHRPGPQGAPQAGTFSPGYGHFGGLARGGVGLTESSPSSSAAQTRPSVPGIAPGIGMLGSHSSSVQMRAGGIPAHLHSRPVQSSSRPAPSPTNQIPSSQNFQGHGALRMPSTGAASTNSPNTPQSVQSLTQPWLASGPQGKPPHPNPSSFRQPLPSQSLHPRQQPPIQLQPQSQPQPQVPSQPQKPVQLLQHAHPLPLTPQPQPIPSSQPLQLPEHHVKQVLPQPPRAPQAISHQQQISRIQGLPNQKPSAPAIVHPNTVQPVPHNRIVAASPGTAEMDESCSRILSKRSIHELVSQVGPSEKLDPEVEEILMDIADEFVESITSFGCSLAKHRKSTTLEAKDILLPLERNWNITLPGFAGDEIKSFRKPPVNDIHKERLAVIKKSAYSPETTANRNPGGQATGNAKGAVKTPVTVFGSPSVKT